ncbi:plant intracellular Ras-group-related LRR protein 7-like, partial [Teleopsis dalmanni]
MIKAYDFFNERYVRCICGDVLDSRANILNLSKHSLKEVPEMIREYSFLVKLYLHVNEISTLPSISNLTNLKILTLDFNQLQEFPVAVCSLENLRFLNISHNNIEEIPKEIGELKFLEVLWCNHTGLMSIAEEIGSCITLDTLGARGN